LAEPFLDSRVNPLAIDVDARPLVIDPKMPSDCFNVRFCHPDSL
jgi:hypothetical protein